MQKNYNRLCNFQSFLLNLVILSIPISLAVNLIYKTERAWFVCYGLVGLQAGLFISEKIINGENEPLIDELNQSLQKSEREKKSFILEIKRLNGQVENLNQEIDNLTHWKDSRNEALADFKILEFQLTQAQETNHKLQWQLEQALADSERYYGEGYQSGYQSRSSELDAESRHLALELENLRLRLQRFENAEKIESKILPLESVITEKLPLLIAGEQRSGKALATQFCMNIYAENQPYLAFCLDVSEGNDPSGTWAKNGVPSTNDPRLFLEFLKVIDANLPNRVLNNDAANFAKQPLMFIIVDELMTCIHSLEREEKQEFEAIFTKLHTQGKKRGIYLIVCSQSHQIQNMKSGSITFLNGGLLRNFYLILLNKCMDKALDYEENFKSKYKDYLAHISGHYRAMFGNLGEFQPIQHPSHHGNKIGDSKPNRLPSKCNLATIPPWLSRVVATMVANGGETVASGGQVGMSPPLEALHSIHPPCPPPQNKSGLDELYEELVEVVNRGDFDALVTAIAKGLNQENSILQIFGIKKSGKNPRYQELAGVYKVVKDHLG